MNLAGRPLLSEELKRLANFFKVSRGQCDTRCLLQAADTGSAD
jgi:hypothetical protein